MNNLLVLVMVLPVLAGILLIFFRNKLYFQRWLSFGVMLANAGIGVYLLNRMQREGILRLDFGGWKPPFGILFVADSFSMLLVVTTSIVAAVCLLYAFYSIGEKREKLFFYPFVNFLVAGVNGSFLTGDLFNLYVNFEIMLLASYVLIAFGSSRTQLKESIKYVVINVVSSFFFLIGIAYLYGAVGTLNMAHISSRVAEVGQTPILTVIGMMFLLVFALKSGLLLYYWLPGSYSAPPTAIAALFSALLTKVGIYAMFRIFTLIFYHETVITHQFIGIMAGLTMIGGSIGAVAYKDVRLIASYNVVIAVGFILVGLSVATPAALEGSVYYLIHDMIVKALLFLVIGTMITLTGSNKINQMSGLIRNYPGLGWIFFIVLLSLAGVPPLSGFIGKLLVGQGAIEGDSYVLLSLAFISSIFVLYSLLRIFLNCFWGESTINIDEKKTIRIGWLVPCIILMIGTIALGICAESLSVYVKDAANTLLHPDIYVDAVLND
ncbi:Na+/H+ antiporter subunit D [Virgibacillus halophilus]|uniref:Na+/H+ antiporter subunit D n=1 Tax=Tigheibacillus halophilus TaxID=361280 RepID=UPI003638C13E